MIGNERFEERANVNQVDKQSLAWVFRKYNTSRKTRNSRDRNCIICCWIITRPT